MVDLSKNSLLKLGIFELRSVGRDLGVKSPTSKKKEDIIEEILAITSGEKEPYVRPNAKGRPPLATSKFGYQATDVPDEVLWDMPMATELKVSSNSDEESVREGIVCITTKGFGFVQADYNVDTKNDAYLETTFITRYKLKTGDKVEVVVKEIPSQFIPTVIDVRKVNGHPAILNEKHLKTFNIVKGKKLIGMYKGENIFNGERVLITSTPSDVINFYNNYKGTKFLVNANSLPEEFIDGAINASCFDKPSTRYRTLDIVVNSAMRLAERGEDVVVCVADIAFLPIAYMEYNSETLGESSYTTESLLKLKQIIANGKALEGAGSVTLICGVNKNVANADRTIENVKVLFNKVF